MKYVLDCHCHSIGSGHAYSTIEEIAKSARRKKLKLIAITDHGPALPGTAHKYFFANLKVLPEKMYGVEILRGTEVNMTDYNGTLDLEEKILKSLDIVLAGYHDSCLPPAGADEHTRGILKVMENPLVDVLVHPGNPLFPVEIDRVLKKARETNTLIEINNSSLWISRDGSLKNCIHIAKLCKKYGVRVIVGSDAHIAAEVGSFKKVQSIFKEIDMPKELILNRSVNVLKDFLRNKNKTRFI